jgi:3-deoxy-D-arabino-heptulosonate 7-phosphate (DAHP) synthase class II
MAGNTPRIVQRSLRQDTALIKAANEVALVLFFRKVIQTTRLLIQSRDSAYETTPTTSKCIPTNLRMSDRVATILNLQ